MGLFGWAIAFTCAGLFFLLKEGVPLLQARRSGAIHTRGYRPRTVNRTTEPERFQKLLDQRRQMMVLGLILFLGGGASTAYHVLVLILNQS